MVCMCGCMCVCVCARARACARVRACACAWCSPFKGCAGASTRQLPLRVTQRGSTLETQRRVGPWRAARAACKKNDDEEEEGVTAVDKFFEPLVEKFAELDEKDQASLAFIYQGTAP